MESAPRNEGNLAAAKPLCRSRKSHESFPSSACRPLVGESTLVPWNHLLTKSVCLGGILWLFTSALAVWRRNPRAAGPTSVQNISGLAYCAKSGLLGNTDGRLNVLSLLHNYLA